MSVRLHISGIIHDMIVNLGTHLQNDPISGYFFYFLEILIFQVVSGVKGQKMIQNDKNSVYRTPYLKNGILYDCHLCYRCTK